MHHHNFKKRLIEEKNMQVLLGLKRLFWWLLDEKFLRYEGKKAFTSKWENEISSNTFKEI